MLVMMAGTMTMAMARLGAMLTASRPMDTVGKPSPTTPLTNPASRKTAAITMRSGSIMSAH
ncbi:hypothetical protein ABIA42_005762 [Bradyrhizobium sp. USDA 327]